MANKPHELYSRISANAKRRTQSFLNVLRDFVFGTPDPDRVDALVIEPRILYSATPFPIDADGYTETHHDLTDDQLAAIEEMIASISLPSLDDNNSSNNEPLVAPVEKRNEAIFIDASLDDIETLLASIESSADNTNFDVYLIEQDSNGLSFIVDVLAQSSITYDAIHWVTHGSSAAIQLGNDLLTSSNIDAYALRSSINLPVPRSLLIYGCNVAPIHDGIELLTRLSAFTGADVAASDDVTGHTSLGWRLGT